MNKSFEEVYKNIINEEDRFWREGEQDVSTDELQVNDPIYEIIEQVGEKYKKTWEELSK